METTPAKTRRTPTRRVKDSPLTESDWVHAATEILVQENVRGIKIDKLCAKLGVTKGSFYWHFRQRSDILTALLKDWRRRATLNVIQSIARSGAKGIGRLRNLIEMTRHPKAGEVAAIEMSIRDWARRVEMPKEAINEVDTIRIQYFEQILLDEGFSAEESRRRSYVAYCIMMGDSILHRTLTDYVSPQEYIDTVLKIMSQPDK